MGDEAINGDLSVRAVVDISSFGIGIFKTQAWPGGPRNGDCGRVAALGAKRITQRYEITDPYG